MNHVKQLIQCNALVF